MPLCLASQNAEVHVYAYYRLNLQYTAYSIMAAENPSEALCKWNIGPAEDENSVPNK